MPILARGKKRIKNKERKKGDDLMAGSEYGGLFFSFKDGRVSRIFIGAIAE
jgi:hypothetical protein